MKKAMLALALAALVAGLGIAWIGYGNPFRTIPFYNFHPDNFHPTNFDPEHYDKVFFLESCTEQGFCSVKTEHQQVLQFELSGRGNPARMIGQGRNPVAVLERAGISFLPSPDYVAAALKWCTNDDIIQQHAYHYSVYVVPLTEDPVATASCVKKQIPISFSVCIADPLGSDKDCDQFASLEDNHN